jgi:hypothetical protein
MVGTSVVAAFATYLSEAYPVEMTDLQDAMSDAKDTISLLPDESLTGGTPSDLRTSMNNELTLAQTALDEEDVVDAVSHVGAAVDLVSDHVATSCPC